MASQVRTVHQPDFFLIVAEDDGWVLAVQDDATLAVFSGEGEAKTFLLLEGREYGRKVRRALPGELISILEGPRASMKRVALDPSPEMIAERLVGLVSMRKDRFLERFTKCDRGLSLTAVP